jgi:hypothetical protein
MTFSTNTIDHSIDYLDVARELIGGRTSKIAQKSATSQSRFSDGSELVPAEAIARMEREGDRFLSRPDSAGATIDREGLTNCYAVMPRVYLADFPSPQQARNYALQGAVAVLFVSSLILTAFAVS